MQDFYDTGEKLTDPYVMNNPTKLAILNFENKDYSAVSVTDDFYHYRFYNAYDTFANLEGKLVTWYKSGKRRSEEYYQGGNPINKLVVWHENGIKAREIDYIAVYSYPRNSNGGISSSIPIEETGMYISGGGWLPNGVIIHYKAWYPNGQLWEDSDFTNNKRYSVKKWYENSQKKIEYYLDNNKSNKGFPKVTSIQLWSEDGKESVNHDQVLAYKHKQGIRKDRKLIEETSNGNLVQEFFINGNKATEPFLTKDDLYVYSYDCVDGKIISYDIDGNKIEERECSKDNSQATFISWYPNGQIREQGKHLLPKHDTFLSSSERIGIWKEWHSNGQLKLERDYDQSDKPSNFVSFYSNGQIKTGKKNGIKIDYGTNPKFYILKEVEIGCCQIYTFVSNNKKLLEYKFRTGEHGEKFGTVTEWYGNGKIAAKGKFNMDSKLGLWQHYYENGNLWMKGEYRGNKQIGIWTYWDKQGNKTKVNKGIK